MKLKVGDKVKIKSLEWYNKNNNDQGTIYYASSSFNKDMSEYCGKETTILELEDEYYKLAIDNKEWYWESWMFEIQLNTIVSKVQYFILLLLLAIAFAIISPILLVIYLMGGYKVLDNYVRFMHNIVDNRY